MEAEDKGHRHGNFSNYYHFHPPQNRLQVLEQCGLMAQIRRGLFGSIDKLSCQGDTETSDMIRLVKTLEVCVGAQNWTGEASAMAMAAESLGLAQVIALAREWD